MQPNEANVAPNTVQPNEANVAPNTVQPNEAKAAPNIEQPNEAKFTSVGSARWHRHLAGVSHRLEAGATKGGYHRSHCRARTVQPNEANVAPNTVQPNEANVTRKPRNQTKPMPRENRATKRPKTPEVISSTFRPWERGEIVAAGLKPAPAVIRRRRFFAPAIIKINK